MIKDLRRILKKSWNRDKDNAMSLKPQLKPELNSRLTGTELDNSRTLLANTYESWLEHIQPVTVPLALISQIQRSGGSLFSQLLDGHPELDAHPHCIIQLNLLLSTSSECCPLFDLALLSLCSSRCFFLRFTRPQECLKTHIRARLTELGRKLH